jgi:hypothetical protein
MALNTRSLVRLTQAPQGTAGGASGSAQNTIWFYATADAAATVEASAYFNGVRAQLTVGDIILAACSASVKLLRVTAVPASGAVTTGMGSVTAG